MKTGRLCFFAILACAPGVAPVRAEFKYGHIYVSASDNDWCTVKGGPAAIIEIDPDTGEMTVFAHSDDHPFCGPGGLRFTPDGSRLLLSEVVLGRIIAFDGDGNSEILIPSIFAPLGIAFDAGDDMYVSVGNSQVLRYPATGGSPTVFANHEDGLFSVGVVDFSPNGDLFWAGHAEDFIIRLTPDGVGFPFDNPFGTKRALALDRPGNLYVSLSLAGCIRYDGGVQSATVELIPPGVASIRAFAFSPDHGVLYGANWTGQIYAIDPIKGGLVMIANVREVPIWAQSFVSGSGMAVHVPVIPGDLNGDGNTTIADFPDFHHCFSGPLNSFTNVWCRAADMDQDGDVDWADFGRFQLVFSEN